MDIAPREILQRVHDVVFDEPASGDHGSHRERTNEAS
jgi:hypothetical protein